MIEAVEALLDDFDKLPDRVERLPTFMEVAGYPHYENVCRNILAFYLDPEQPHGLGALVLDAFARVGSIALPFTAWSRMAWLPRTNAMSPTWPSPV